MVKYASSRYSILEPILYFFIIFVFVVIGLFYINHMVDKVEKRMHLMNAKEIIRIVKQHHTLYGAYPHLEMGIRYADYSLGLLYLDQIVGDSTLGPFDHLGSIKDVYSRNSFVRVISLREEKYYQILLCREPCDSPFLNTVTELTSGEIRNSVDISSLTVDDIQIEERNWWNPFYKMNRE